MSKRVIVLFISLLLSFEFCLADIVYYKNNFMITNCKVLSVDESKYEIETYTKNGSSIMILPEYLVDVVISQNIDSTIVSKIVPKTKNDEKKAKYLRGIKNKGDKYKAIEEKNRIDEENRLKAIEKREKIKIAKMKNNQKISGDYYYKTNIPLLATGIALSTHGVVSLISTINLKRLIDEFEESGLITETYTRELKNDLIDSYIYGTLFTVTGIIDIYYSFEKVSIEIEKNQLTLSYNF